MIDMCMARAKIDARARSIVTRNKGKCNNHNCGRKLTMIPTSSRGGRDHNCDARGRSSPAKAKQITFCETHVVNTHVRKITTWKHKWIHKTLWCLANARDHKMSCTWHKNGWIWRKTMMNNPFLQTSSKINVKFKNGAHIGRPAECMSKIGRIMRKLKKNAPAWTWDLFVEATFRRSLNFGRRAVVENQRRIQERCSHWSP